MVELLSPKDCTATIHQIDVSDHISSTYSTHILQFLPEIADLNEGPGRGPVPGVLVDQEEHHLLQSDGNLTKHGTHVVR